MRLGNHTTLRLREGHGLLPLLALAVAIPAVVAWHLSIEAAVVELPSQRLGSAESVFALQPLGVVPPQIVERHAHLLAERFDARVEIQPARPWPKHALDAARGQVRADLLLDDLYVKRPAYATHVVGIIAQDLYAEGWEFLYGFSQVQGHAAVYSLARSSPSSQTGLAGARTSLERLEKVILHEVGHTFDLGHCGRAHCVMTTVDTPDGLDRMSRFFCQRCARRLRDHVEPPIDPLVARGDGLFGRGAFERAWMRYTLAMLMRPTNVEIINRLGVASAASGSPATAERAYRLAITRAPQFPLPYYNLGLLYAAIDPEASARHLQAGFVRDPDRVEALGFLGTVYLEVLRDEHRALWYYQRYVGEGGQNPDVLYRYREMIRPSMFELAIDEATVIRGSYPGAGTPGELGPFVDSVLRLERLVAARSGPAAWLSHAARWPRVGP